MSLKQKLINNLPPSAKRIIALPYDYLQVKKANREFSKKTPPDISPSGDAPDHIILIVVDALRGDVISNETTPFLSDLSGTTNAIAPSVWTFPSVSSILTGKYPHQHGAIRSHDRIVDGMDIPPKVPTDSMTITEIFSGAGYSTYGGFGHDTPFVSVSGRFESHDLHHKVNSNADKVFDRYISWLKENLSGKTFGYIHLADPHIPVDPPDKYWSEFNVDSALPKIRNWDYTDSTECGEDCQYYRDNRKRLYRASVKYVDEAISRLHRNLDNLGIDPVFIVTSDHGEMFWEKQEFDLENFEESRSVGHGGAPYEGVTRVPVLSNNIDIDDEDVSLIDLAPSLLDMAGIKDHLDTSGVSLLNDIPRDRLILVESCLSGYEKKAVYKNKWKLIVSKGDDVSLSFSLPDEGIAEIPEDVQSEMMDFMPEWPKDSETGTDQTEVSGIVENRLEELGYK